MTFKVKICYTEAMEQRSGYYLRLLTCRKCTTNKPLIEFTPRENGRYHSWCKDCVTDYQREYNNRPEVQDARWSKARIKYYKDKYNITVEQFEAMSEAQDHLCAICHEPCKSGKRLAVDHDHKCCSGKKSCGKCIRGLICFTCNSGLNKFRDSPPILYSAILYLEAYERGQE